MSCTEERIKKYILSGCSNARIAAKIGRKLDSELEKRILRLRRDIFSIPEEKTETSERKET